MILGEFEIQKIQAQGESRAAFRICSKYMSHTVDDLRALNKERKYREMCELIETRLSDSTIQREFIETPKVFQRLMDNHHREVLTQWSDDYKKCY